MQVSGGRRLRARGALVVRGRAGDLDEGGGGLSPPVRRDRGSRQTPFTLVFTLVFAIGTREKNVFALGRRWMISDSMTG